MKTIVSLFSGVLFALGLSISGMTDPAKVTGFLDVTGAWDSSLIWVMVGAIGVFASAFWGIKKSRPLLAPTFNGPQAGMKVDGRLVIGSAIFGLGWGLSGICPGPALVNAASGGVVYLVFAFAMATTLVVARRASQISAASRADDVKLA
jgi:uncharacterized membrane protein YedE/YeeE